MIETVGILGLLAFVLGILLNDNGKEGKENLLYGTSFAIVVMVLGILVPMFGGMIEGEIIDIAEVTWKSVVQGISGGVMYGLGTFVPRLAEEMKQ